MTRFDHVLVMVSIIIGLGATQWLNDISRLIEIISGGSWCTKINAYTPHTIWAFLAFGLLLQFWWAIWQYRDEPDERWTYPDYVIVLLAGTFLYLACELALPSDLESTPIRLDDFFKQISIYFFSCLSLYLALTILLRKRVRRIRFVDRSNIIRYVAITATLSAAGTAAYGQHSYLIHIITASICALLFTGFILYFNPYRLARLNQRTPEATSPDSD